MFELPLRDERYDYGRFIPRIVEAASDIWDRPKVIFGFTDHGRKHSERIVNILAHILSATGQTNPLLPVEEFILWASAFLHDIGMQCAPKLGFGAELLSEAYSDPDFRRHCERLGINDQPFEFDKSKPFEYSIDEQNEIRRMHGILVSIWLQNLNSRPQSSLAIALREVPVGIVQAIAHCCKFHTFLSIGDCGQIPGLPSSEINLQKVAALLRIADELDVDDARAAKRYDIDDYGLPAINSAHWHVHARTAITRHSQNWKISANLSIKDDSRLDQVFHLVIDNLVKKCTPCELILASLGIPLTISEGAVNRVNAEPLPDDVVAFLLGGCQEDVDSGSSPGAGEPHAVQETNAVEKALELSEELQRNSETMYESLSLESKFRRIAKLAKEALDQIEMSSSVQEFSKRAPVIAPKIYLLKGERSQLLKSISGLIRDYGSSDYFHSENPSEDAAERRLKDILRHRCGQQDKRLDECINSLVIFNSVDLNDPKSCPELIKHLYNISQFFEESAEALAEVAKACVMGPFDEPGQLLHKGSLIGFIGGMDYVLGIQRLLDSLPHNRAKAPKIWANA